MLNIIIRKQPTDNSTSNQKAGLIPHLFSYKNQDQTVMASNLFKIILDLAQIYRL